MNIVEIRKKIVVVEDDHILARTLALVLDRSGYETLTFFTAEAAMAEMDATQPDLVMTDVVMPGMNGIQLAELLARNYPQMRVLVMSGRATYAKLIDEARARGFNVEVHIKPVHPKTLLRMVEESLAEN